MPHIKVEEKLHEMAGLTEQSFVVTGLPDEKKGERLAVLRKQVGPERWEALSGTEEVVRAPVGLVDGQTVQRAGEKRMRAGR